MRVVVSGVTVLDVQNVEDCAKLVLAICREGGGAQRGLDGSDDLLGRVKLLGDSCGGRCSEAYVARAEVVGGGGDGGGGGRLGGGDEVVGLRLDGALGGDEGCDGASAVETGCGRESEGASGVPGVVPGKHAARNRAKRLKERVKRAGAGTGCEVPAWRRTAAGNGSGSSSSFGSAPSLAATVATVTTEVAEELEAKRTLAARRVVENKVATKMGELRLASLHDKDKTSALARLELARIQERINTATAKSQASYKKCDSPLDSVGSAGSAGEFAWKQEIRKRDVVEKELDNVKVQLDKMLLIATPEQRRIIAEIPAFIPPTWEELAQEDEDISPYYTMDEMLAEAAKYAHG